MLFCGVWMRQNSLAHFFICATYAEIYKDLPDVTSRVVNPLHPRFGHKHL